MPIFQFVDSQWNNYPIGHLQGVGAHSQGPGIAGVDIGIKQFPKIFQVFGHKNMGTRSVFVAYTLQPDPPPWTLPEQGISRGWEPIHKGQALLGRHIGMLLRYGGQHSCVLHGNTFIWDANSGTWDRTQAQGSSQPWPQGWLFSVIVGNPRHPPRAMWMHCHGA